MARETRGLEDDLQRHAAFVVEEVTGRLPTSITRMPRGVMTFKFAVGVSPDQYYVVRMYPASRSGVVNYEPSVLQRCQRHGIPVPSVVTDSRTGPEIPLQYVVYEMIDGIPLSELFSGLASSERNRVATQLVTYLFALQGLQMTGYGDVLDGERAQFDSWSAFVQHSFAEGLREARRRELFSEEVMNRLDAAGRKLAHMNLEGPTGLAWGDVSPDNILIDSGGEIVGLLDFEGVLAAEALLNLGYCYAGQHATEFFESMVRAWPHELTDDHRDRLELYAVLRACRILKNGDDVLPTGKIRTPIHRLLPGFQEVLDRV